MKTRIFVFWEIFTIQTLIFAQSSLLTSSQQDSSATASIIQINGNAYSFNDNNSSEFSKEVPSLLEGIWEGSDRFVYFMPVENSLGEKSSSFALMLKTLYGWYYDRACEDEFLSNYKRDLNSVTASSSEKVSVEFSDVHPVDVSFRTIAEDSSSGVWEILLTYVDKSTATIPVAIINGNLYLNFITKVISQTENSDLGQNLNGYWKGIGQVSGITISTPVTAEELVSFYIADNVVYHIRYWQTDMEYSPLMATFSDGDKTYSVAKHIQSSGKIYTCVTGRSVQIRNVERSPFNFNEYSVNNSLNICAFGKPYLIHRNDLDSTNSLDETARIENYMQLAILANSRRKTDPPPLFPPSDANWHWDEIRELEKDNPLIQDVRNRQRDFARQSQASN